MRSASTETCCFSSATLVDAGTGARLQEEGALAGRADRARDEALGRVEAVDHRCHGTNLEGRPSTATDGGVRAPGPAAGPLPRRRPQVREVAGERVHAHHERPHGRASVAVLAASRLVPWRR